MPDARVPVPSGKIPPKAPAFIGAAVLLAATVLTAPSEGFRSRPYWDPAHIRTYCLGETSHVVERDYSRAECEILLETRLANDYAPPLAKCLPELEALPDAKRVKIFAAFLDAAYNAGAGRVCSSRMARALHAGAILPAVCRGFAGWFTTARDRRTGARTVYPGLVKRRDNEMKLCLEGALA